MKHPEGEQLMKDIDSSDMDSRQLLALGSPNDIIQTNGNGIATGNSLKKGESLFSEEFKNSLTKKKDSDP